MLKIRLQRIGRKGKPNYRIVVSEHSAAANKNSYVEQLGHYNPLAVGQSFHADKDKLLEWIKKGAKPTNTLARLLKGDGVKDMEPYIVEMKDRKKKKAEEEKAEAPKSEEKAEEKKEDEPGQSPAPSEEEKAEAPKSEEKVEEKKEEEPEQSPAPSEPAEPAEEKKEEKTEEK